MARALVSVIVVTVIFSVATPISCSIPFIVVHGLGDECQSSLMNGFTEPLSNWSGSPGYCIEVGNGILDSWFMPLQRQTDILCEEVKKMEELKEGFNIVAVSQGTLIARGMVQFCDGLPPVRNFISVHGPQAGVASVPLCERWDICILVAELIKLGVYNDFVQAHLAPSGYIKIPTAMELYLEKSSFLPKLNNERPNERNSTYKERFSSLNTLVLLMAENETIVHPKKSSWFGYFPEGSWFPILPPQQTSLYKEDWIGLKKLNDEGRVEFISVPGGHVEISHEKMKKYIVPYLVDELLPPLKLTKRGTGGDIKSQTVFI